MFDSDLHRLKSMIICGFVTYCSSIVVVVSPPVLCYYSGSVSLTNVLLCFKGSHFSVVFRLDQCLSRVTDPQLERDVPQAL